MLIYTEAELPQRSQEWLEIRQNKIGGSEIPTILGYNEKYDKARTIWKRKTGRVKPKETTDAMLRGAEMEPEALEEIRKNFAVSGLKDINIQQYFVIHPKHDFVAVSFDGVDLNNNYIVEIKCPTTTWNFKKVLENGIPEHYYPQVQWQLAVAKETWGIDTAFFCSYFPDGVYTVNFDNFKEVKETLAVVRVTYDEEYFNAMLKVAEQFHHFLVNDYWDDVIYNETVKEFNESINRNSNTDKSEYR